jgi:hypothetical protein
MVTPDADPGEVTIVVPPLNVSPMSVGPTAVAGGTLAALAPATGAAIATAAMTAVTKATRRRRVVAGAAEVI